LFVSGDELGELQSVAEDQKIIKGQENIYKC